MPVNKLSKFAIKTIGSHTQRTTNGVATLTRPEGATGIIIQNSSPALSGDNIRYTLDDTTNPTASLGFLLEPGDGAVRIDFFSNIRVFLTNDAVLEYQWFTPE